MKPLVHLSNRFTHFIHNASAILLTVASVLVFYQVITRFVIGHSATWTEVLARAVIIGMVFLVCGPAIRLGRMTPIDAIRHMMPKHAQIWLIRFVVAATLSVLGVLIWYGYQMTLRVMGQRGAMLDVSAAWFYAALSIGSALALLDAERTHYGDEETAP